MPSAFLPVKFCPVNRTLGLNGFISVKQKSFKVKFILQVYIINSHFPLISGNIIKFWLT